MSSQILETEQERAVWARVMAGRAEPPTESCANPELSENPDNHCSTEPEQLLTWAEDECRTAALYRYLARCLPVQSRCWLLEIAHDEQCHARTLAAYYYSVTGHRAQLQSDFIPRHTPRELLRQQYQLELDASAAYHDAAHCTEGELQLQLDQFSRDEARHARMVMCLLECVI